MKRIIYLVCIHLLCSTAAQASNLRQISSREGISNNAILSLAQDKHGFIWVGSCDGLNMWDGERMRLFPNDWGEYTPLSGNLIEEIAVTTDSLFWIRTNYGLDLFDPDSAITRAMFVTVLYRMEGQPAVDQKAGFTDVAEGSYYAAVEGSRGEFGVFIESRGDKFPYRMKFRSTGLPLVSCLETIARGTKIADLIAIGGTLDYVVPDIDR